MCPARGAVAALTVKFTVPLPIPEPPEVIVIHGALLNAVHGQSWSEVTPTLPDPPAAPKSWLIGAIEYVQVEATKFAVWSAPNALKDCDGGSNERLSFVGVTTYVPPAGSSAN